MPDIRKGARVLRLHSHRSSFLPTKIVFFCVLLTLSACGAVRDKIKLPSLGDSSGSDKIVSAARKIEQERLFNLPEVAIGDTYVFDNPVVSWEVVNVRDDRVTWVSNQGAQIVTSNNPLLPSFEWVSQTEGEGKRLISDIEGGLFPLATGNQMGFRSTVSVRGQQTQWSFQWQCAILDEIEISVPAGKFDTFRISCARDTNDTITYYFSPDLGYYVRMETGGSKGALLKQRNLLSFNNFAGASLQAANRLSISDDEEALDNNELAPVLPLPIDDVRPNKSAGIEAGRLLQQTRPLIADTEPVTVLPVPGTLQAIDPSGNLSRNAPADQNRPQSLIPDPAQGSQGTLQTVDPSQSNILAGQTIVIHLASYNSQETAERGWQILSNAYPRELGDKRPRILRTDLGNLGIFYRLYAAPFSSLQAAAAACQRFRNQGLYCQVSEI